MVSAPGAECLDRNGETSDNPCGTMLNRLNSDENRANCFEKCVTESGIEGSGVARDFIEEQFGDLDELIATLCVAL